jgi:hypothetical protein
MVKMTRLTQRRHPGASPQRERKRVLKMLFDETGLKSPIFYSEDFAIDGAAMPKKLCACSGRHRLKECRGTVPVGAE